MRKLFSKLISQKEFTMNRDQYLRNARIIMVITSVAILLCFCNALGVHAASNLSITSVSAQAPTADLTRNYNVTLSDGSMLTLDVPVLQVQKPVVGPCTREMRGGFLGFFQHEAIVQNGAEFAIR